MFEQDTQKQIRSIQFGLFGPEEIKRGSVVHVIHPETVENGIPKEAGLIDLRMGTTEKSFLCQTCNGSSFECAGHYGHIELSKPMFHVGYLTKIKKTLECVCFYCSKIKISKNKLDEGLEHCWTALKFKNICEGEVTSEGKTGCGNKQPSIKKEGLNLIAFMKEDEDNEGKVVLNGERVYNILKKIPEEDYRFLGFHPEFCKPEWMILCAIIVPPPAVRPSIVLNGYLRGEDDLTHKLADIVKSNAYLKKYEQEGAPGHIVRDYEQLLQFHLATLIDNDIGGQPQALQKNGRPLKSISARLKGKEGRIRGNLMGKRVDFSARSVISPDPNISVQEVGVPVGIAKVHTFPEKVNSFNIDYLQELVDRGPNEHPGANYLIRSDGQRIDLNFNRHELKLEKGFIVERHMQNNDEVLFNRQPSLHKMSMMGHRAKIMQGKTFRLNLSATSPYNADFDGDEMNLHMPQSYPSKSELCSLTSVSKQIVSPQSNKPVIGIVQDTLVGAFLFTIRDSFFKRAEAMSLLYNLNVFGKKNQDFIDFMKPTILEPVELWTGKQIFSAILPRIFYDRQANVGIDQDISDRLNENKEWNTMNCTDSRTIIKNGVLLAGRIDVVSIGTKQGGIIQIIYNDCGSNAALNFIDSIQRLINYFLLHISSFSIGIGDCIADSRTLDVCRKTVKKAMDEVDDIITITKRNELDKLPGMSLSATFESKVNVILNKARNIPTISDETSERMGKKSFRSNLISPNNNMKSMVLSGSKGSYINISQITTCMGQQNVEGKRIPFGFNERSLPHFYKYDYTARSRGFVQNSYISGMWPDEFFFHAMGGREGIIDTSIKTAETGYIQRRLVKALEDATAQHDYSVRNGSGDIYQFKYGDDSFDATHLENISLDLADFKDKYFIDMFGDENYAIKPSQVSSDVYEMMRDDLDLQKLLDAEYEYLYTNRALMSGFYSSPVNIGRILSNKIYLKNHELTVENSKNNRTISPYVILSSLDAAMTGNKKLDYYIRISLNIKFVLLNLSLANFNGILDEIALKIMKSRVNANEMVGTLAAQSVGEPATQMTLNTFHLAGVASTHSMGVPRLNEIINLAKNIRTPFMKVFLSDNLGFNLENVRNVQNKIEFLSMKMACVSSQIIYDPEIKTTVIPEDRGFVHSYFEMPDEEIDYDLLDKFVIRLELSRSVIVSKRLTLDFISLKIKNAFSLSSSIITSDDNDERLIIRIRFSSDLRDSLLFYYESLSKILKIHLQGYPQVKKAHITSHTASTSSGESAQEWFLQTDGISFLSMLSAQDIDPSRVVANDILTIYHILGVEAARQAILNELTDVLESTAYVNHRHMSLLADVMSVKGFLTGITRHGVSRESQSALKRASFEETVDVLLDAACNSELDRTKGVSENIMLGQLAPVGTGNVELILDIKKLDHVVPFNLFAGGETPMIQSPGVISTSGDWSSAYSPICGPDISSFSPLTTSGFSPDTRPGMSPLYDLKTPMYRPTSTAYTPTSTSYNPYSVTYQPNTPTGGQSPNSYGARSPTYSPYSVANNPRSSSQSPSMSFGQYSPMPTGYSPLSSSYDSHSSYKPCVSPKISPLSPSFEFDMSKKNSRLSKKNSDSENE